MENILLTTIGHRDIKYNNELPDKKDFRNSTLKILEEIKNDETRIDNILLPIIGPSIDSIQKQENISLDFVIIFATDQEDENFKRTDTINSAQIIKIFLKKKLNKDSRIFKIKYNPNDYDTMIKEFDKLLNDRREFLKGKEFQLYGLCAGGVPACITALLFNGIKIFKNKFLPYYKAENRNSAERLNYNKLLQIEFLKQQLDSAKKTYDFSGMINILKEADTEESKKGILISELLLNMYNNNFDISKNIFQKINELDLDVCLRQLLADCIVGNNELDYKELFYKIEIKLERKEYRDFVIYFGILIEYILTKTYKQIRDERLKQLDIDNPYKFKKQFLSKTYKDIAEYIINDEFIKQSADRKLNLGNIGLSKPVIATLIKYYYEQPNISEEEKEIFEKIYKFNKSVLNIIKLRNNVIHKNIGVGIKDIEEIINIEDLIQKVKEILDYLEIETSNNFYKKALEYIKI